MNPNWLTQLAPSHAPAPPSWWPPAPGWWVVAVLCIAVIAFAAWRWIFSTRARYRRRRRAALKELNRIRTFDDGVATARAIQRLMRRYALSVFERERVAKLSGDAWIAFVVEQGGSILTGDTGRSLLSAAFGTTAALDQREHWLQAAEGFIRAAPIESAPARGGAAS